MVSRRGDPRACRERCQGQQEVPHHPKALSARHQERRGAEQAAVRRVDRPGRGPAQHPGRPPPQEECWGRGKA